MSAQADRATMRAIPLSTFTFHCLVPTLPRSMKAKVIVMPKQSVLDPQGVAVREAIHHHGLPAAKSVRVGKFVEIELDGTQTEAALHEVCRDLLSNPVIEDYQLRVEG
jgi:phosphoribosylformylglycinamidine synthase